MPISYNKYSTNEDYTQFLKELGILNNTTSKKKKDINKNFKGRKFEYNKYLMIS